MEPRLIMAKNNLEEKNILSHVEQNGLQSHHSFFRCMMWLNRL
jgi:hypothetical protein